MKETISLQSNDTKELVIKLSTEGHSSRSIENILGISKSTINYFLSKETWKEWWDERDSLADYGCLNKVVKSNKKGRTHLIIADTQVKPNQDLGHIKALGKYINELRPEVIVCIGDWWDMESLSSYDKGKLSFEGRRVKADLDAGNDAMKLMMEQFKSSDYNPELAFTLGNHECLTPDTDVLTKDGWKGITEVTKEDLVASMGAEDELVWDYPKSLVSKHYEDDLVVYSGRSFSFSGTKKHRVYHRSQAGNNLVTNAEDMKENFEAITSLKNTNDEYDISDELLKLSAWLATDSHFPKGGRNPVLYQRESNAHKIQDLLDTLGVDYKLNKRDRDIKEVCGKVLKNRPEVGYEFYLRDNPTEVTHNKYLPEFAGKLSKRQWEVFFETLIDADGSIPTRATSSRVFYGSKEMCDSMQQYAVQFGWSASLSEYRDTHWRVNLCEMLTRRQEKTPKELVPYSGMVYCLEMPKENFVIRHNNKVHVTGNCRITRFASDNPEFEGLLGYNLLNLEQYGWEVYEFLQPCEVDGITYVHYLANPFTGKPYGGNALNQLKNVGCSFVVGHKQTLDIAIRPTLNGKMQLGIINGAYYKHNEDYKGHQGNHHFRGVTVLHDVEDGFGNPMVVSLDTIVRDYGEE